MFHVDPFDAITESNESDNDMYSSARIVPIPLVDSSMLGGARG
jgi:hypothetical protein